MEEKAWQEVLERLARIETKLDNYESIREKAEQAHLIALNNADDIKEFLRNILFYIKLHKLFFI